MDIVDELRAGSDGWTGDAACVSSEVAGRGAAEIERLRAKVAEAEPFLVAIAEGYAAHGADERFAVVENPEASEEAKALRGIADFLVVDTASFRDLETDDESPDVGLDFP